MLLSIVAGGVLQFIELEGYEERAVFYLRGSGENRLPVAVWSSDASIQLSCRCDDSKYEGTEVSWIQQFSENKIHKIVIEMAPRIYSTDDALALDAMLNQIAVNDDVAKVGPTNKEDLSRSIGRSDGEIIKLFDRCYGVNVSQFDGEKVAVRNRLKLEKANIIRLPKRVTIREISIFLDERRWKKPAATFSSMMRFLQRETSTFYWKKVDDTVMVSF